MTLATAYALPYAVLYGRDRTMSVGQDVRVVATLATIPSPAAVDALDALVQPFLLLAQSGAMAGATIPPWLSTIADKDGPTVNGDSAEWLLRQCTTDERAITMLAQMFVSVQQISGIRQLTVLRTDEPGGDLARLVRNEASAVYPNTSAMLPFRLSQTSELSDEIVVSATFSEVLPASLRQRVDGDIHGWAAGLLSGAYGVAPVQPDECSAVIDDLEWRGAEVTVALTRFLAHPSAIDGLVNVFAALHERTAKVAELIVE